MKKISMLALMAALMMVSAVAASSASATGWHSNGSIAFTSTDAGATRLIITPTSGSRVSVNCASSRGSGTLNADPAATVNPWNGAASVTPAFSSCTVSGAGGYSVTCGAASLNAVSYVGPDTYPALSGVTTGTLTGISCTLKFGTTTCSTITGRVDGTYTNPSSSSTPGRLTIRAANQALTATGTGCAAVPQGSGQFGAPSGTGVTDVVYTTSAVGTAAPIIWYGRP